MGQPTGWGRLKRMRWRLFARRLAILIASLLIASFVIFAALYLAPGNPVAALSGGRPLPPGSIHVLDQRYHLNEPFLTQYWYWLDNALHGNLGISIALRENVSTLIASRIWTTAGLVLYASVIIVETFSRSVIEIPRFPCSALPSQYQYWARKGSFRW